MSSSRRIPGEETLVFLTMWTLSILLAFFFPILYLWFKWEEYQAAKQYEEQKATRIQWKKDCICYDQEEGWCMRDLPELDCPCSYYSIKPINTYRSDNSDET